MAHLYKRFKHFFTAIWFVGISTLLACGPELIAGGTFLAAPQVKASQPTAPKYFNEYILRAVEQLNAQYHLKGYSINAVFTHDIPYWSFGVVKSVGQPRTMCVAAVAEVMLTAFDIYTRETGDLTPFKYLPKDSWEGYDSTDIRAHIWVNGKLNAWGTADALRNFGMGEFIAFENLQPGMFLNLNRVKGTGHAVIFLAFIDKEGNEYKTYNQNVIGFKYFSSQGGWSTGGFDYVYGIFSKHGCPEMPGKKRDCGIIYSTNPKYLNTGAMWMPSQWQKHVALQTMSMPLNVPPTRFDAKFFDGVITDME